MNSYGPANFIIAIADFTIPTNPVVTTFNPPAPPSLDADENIQRIVTGDTTASWVRLYDTSLNLLATANSTLNSVDYISLSGLRALAGSNNTFQVALIDFSVTPPGVTTFDPQVGGGGSCTVIKGTRGACGAVLGSDVELFDVTASPPAPLGTANTNLAGIASLGIGTIAPVFTASPASLAFGAVNVNTTSQAQTVTLANTGNAPLNVTALATSSPRYTASPSGTLPPIAAGQSTTVQVTFTPTAVQSYPATLTMTTNDPSHPTVSIPLTGAGGQPTAAWTPASLAFGTIETGTTSSLNLALINSGSATLHVTGITASPPVFTATPALLSVSPGGTQTIQVSFSPTAAGSFTANLVFQTDDPSHATVSVPMTGDGVPPTVSWTPARIDFGAIAPGASVARDLSIANNGTSDLHITNAQVTYSGSQSDGFSVSAAALTIAPVQTGSLTVTYSAPSPWPFGVQSSADLKFQTDNAALLSGDVPLSGTIQPWGCLSTPAALAARAFKAGLSS